tara:strand:- start:82 stop:483 length:402 start_codon:yes stop_codon:yes gene_type:complete
MNEERVVAVLSPVWNLSFFKTHNKATFDYAMMRDDEIYGLAEIKCRTTPSNAYPTYMISTRKLHDCTMLANFISVPFILIVSFSDQIMYWDGSGYITHGIGGRRDRNDNRDMEIVTHIPIENFEPAIKNGPVQ